MTRRFMGVRWWLGAAFAVVAAVSTAIVVAQYSSRSESALRVNGAQQAKADAFDAATQLGKMHPLTDRTVAQVAQRNGLRIAVYNGNGNLIAGVPSSLDRSALATDRYDGSTSNGRVFIVGLPFRGGTLVARDVRPDVAAAIGI